MKNTCKVRSSKSVALYYLRTFGKTNIIYNKKIIARSRIRIQISIHISTDLFTLNCIVALPVAWAIQTKTMKGNIIENISTNNKLHYVQVVIDVVPVKPNATVENHVGIVLPSIWRNTSWQGTSWIVFVNRVIDSMFILGDCYVMLCDKKIQTISVVYLAEILTSRLISYIDVTALFSLSNARMWQYFFK